MSDFHVKLTSKAYRDLDQIYHYISQELIADAAARKILSDLEDAILSLDAFPARGTLRRHGKYAQKGYRQLFIHNYTIIYQIKESQKQVIVMTVVYTARQF